MRKLLIIISLICLPAVIEAKTILITGASGDIGVALAEYFLKNNDKVICQYNKNKERLTRVESKFPKQMRLIIGDFTKPETIKQFWNDVTKDGKIDIVINSAGIEKEDITLEQIQNTININYLSPRLICDYAIEHFLSNKIQGIIINLGSRAGYRGLPKGYYTYADTKAALHKYSQDIAKDNANKGILVYVVAPGPVRGSMFDNLKPSVKQQSLDSLPTKKPVEIEEIVSLVELLASGKIPSGTGGVFDLMGASVAH